MQYLITRQDRDEVAIDIWLEQEKIFHLFVSTICASKKIFRTSCINKSVEI